MLRRFLSILIAATLACASAPSDAGPLASPAPPPPGAGIRILFLGNSLTYVHDVPQLVAQLASAAGKPAPTIVSRAEPNYALEDHWNDAATRAMLRDGNFDYVIMQQGPSTLDESRVELLRWAKMWSDAARAASTTPAIYAVWPPRGGNLAAGIMNYTDAATESDAVLFPVAHAWREAWAIDPALPLYGPDGFHQSEHGAWLAAVVIAAAIYDINPDAFPNLFPAKIQPAQEAAMKSAASRVVVSAAH